jgi:hypothetical protein
MGTEGADPAPAAGGPPRVVVATSVLNLQTFGPSRVAAIESVAEPETRIENRSAVATGAAQRCLRRQKWMSGGRLVAIRFRSLAHFVNRLERMIGENPVEPL